MVNPWNNTKTETMELTEYQLVNTRQVLFSVYTTEPRKYQLKLLLAHCPEAMARYVLSTPALFDRLLTNTLLDTPIDPTGTSFIPFTRLVSDLVAEERARATTAPVDKLKRDLQAKPTDSAIARELLNELVKARQTIDIAFLKDSIIEAASILNTGRLDSRGKAEDRTTRRRTEYIRLLSAYFSEPENLAFITGTMHLRSFFIEKAFLKNDIPKLFTDKERSLYTLMSIMSFSQLRDVLQNGAITPNRLKEAVLALPIDHITASDINTFFNFHPDELIAGINAIKAVHPTLAAALVEKIQQRLLTTTPTTEKEDLIRTLNSSLDLETVARKALAPLTSLSVNYSGLSSPQLIEEKKQQLIAQYTALITQESSAAEHILITLGKPSVMNKIMADIEAGAVAQLALLSSFTTDLSDLKRRIEATDSFREKRPLMKELLRLYQKSAQRMSPDTFNELILPSFISIRAGDDPEELLIASKDIKCSLISYYFVGESAEYTLPGGDFRSFMGPIFPKEEIIKLFKQEELPSLIFFSILTNHVLNDQFAANNIPQLIDYIKKLKSEHIDELFMANLCPDLEFADIRTMRGLTLLYTHNKAIFSTIAHKLVTMNRSKEMNDFILKNKDSEVFQFKERATQALSPLQNFSVDFSLLDTKEEVEEKKLALINQLNELAKTPAIQSANEMLLALNEGREGLKEQFVANKIKEIEDKANAQLASIAANSEEAALDELMANPTLETSSRYLDKLYSKGKSIEPHILRTYIIEPAIQQKIGLEDLLTHQTADERSARRAIYSALLSNFYHKFLYSSTITNTMSLRTVFVNGAFAKNNIDKLFTHEELPTHILTAVIVRSELQELLSTTEATATEGGATATAEEATPLKKAVRALNANQIDVDDLLAIPYNNLVSGLKAVYSENTGLVKQLIEKIHLKAPTTNPLVNELATLVLDPLTHFSVNFDALNSSNDINAKAEELKQSLNRLCDEQRKGAGTFINLSIDTIAKSKIEEITSKAAERVNACETMKRFKQGVVAEANRKELTTRNIDFISCMKSANDMAKRFEIGTPKYKAAITLYEGLLDKHNKFIQGDMNVLAFRDGCLHDIREARPDLERHRGWKGILKSLANAIISIAESLGLKDRQSDWGFFKPKTKSQKTIDNVTEEINKLNSSR